MLENIKSVKGIAVVVILLILGIVFVVLGSYGNLGGKEAKGESEYAAIIEKRLEKVLSNLDGVSEIDVNVSVGYRTNEYTQSAIYIFADGNGDLERELTVSGVVIICKGGENANIQKRIMETVNTLLGVPYSKVCVYGRA